MTPHEALVQAIRRKATPLRDREDLAPLIERLAQARIVMLGEATHGTREFYEIRRMISEELVSRHGFGFIAVEGDWPHCRRLHRFALGEGPGDAREAVRAFHRWPTWMWANEEIAGLASWLRGHNARLAASGRRPAGFHGLDVYSLFESLDAVLKRLAGINPFLARRARARYACFEPHGRDETRYARSLMELPEGCERQVVEMLQDLLRLRLEHASEEDEEALFDAVQNARIVRNAEAYFRAMIHGTEDSWNVRDRHMMETLDVLLDRYGPRSKAIVWAHNTHIGDYRATDMERLGQLNLGGLARQGHGSEQVALVGFGTYEGAVVASHAWDGPIEELAVPPGRDGSIEAALHEAALSRGWERFSLVFDRLDRHGPLSETHGHRAIGVVYDPRHERWGNYVPTSLARRYDAFVFVDRTRALRPIPTGFDRHEIPETWPAGQ